MWPKVHVKTSHGDPARSNPRNHHKNAIKDQRPGRPKKGQKTKDKHEPRKRRLAVHVKTIHGDPAWSNPRNHHKNAIKDQQPKQSDKGDKKKSQRKVKR
jgi:hypothetical protein